MPVKSIKRANHHSHPIPITKSSQKIAIRVISQFGEESTKVIEV